MTLGVCLQEGADRGYVEVVRGLVEHEHVARRKAEGRESYASLQAESTRGNSYGL